MKNPPPPLCRTDLSEGSMSFDLLKARLVNTALMCKAGLDSSTYMYMFSSYWGYFIFGVLFLISMTALPVVI